jgi:uncharacterized protein
MTEAAHSDKRFGEIAIEKELITKEKFERSLVMQRVIFNRTNVHLPIGAVLVKMALLTEQQVAQVDEVLTAEGLDGAASTTIPPPDETPPANSVDEMLCPLELTVAADKLSAFLEPFEEKQAGPSLEAVKALLVEKQIFYGVIDDSELIAYLQQNPLPMEPFAVARATPPKPGRPPETRFHFDTDPMRIGTLLADGTMDWKNRGDIPQVTAGDLLAEKVGGVPGTPGTNVHGQEVAPPRIKDPPLKFSKGAERSEDGLRILAKINGTPKLGADGRVGVFAILPIDSDIGVETGNIDFDGHIEVNGGVTSGYAVKGRSLNTKEIQNARIEIEENLTSYGGIYASTLSVGGNLKASHIHNSTMEVTGDLIVEKEVFGCTIEVNGRCLLDGGKIIASKISAKKGIQVKDVGTLAAKPSELIVGVDAKFEREMSALKKTIAEVEQNKVESEASIVQLKAKIDALDIELGKTAQEQDGCMVQKRNLEAKLEGPAISQNAEKRALLEGLIGDLAARFTHLDNKVRDIMALDDQVRTQIAKNQQGIQSFEEQLETLEKAMDELQEAAEKDIGIPVVKVSGMIYSRSTVAGPHRKIVIPQEMKGVRIAETQIDPKQYEMKISGLR